MGLKRCTAAEAIARLAEFDTVIDARSESEFAEDHLPGAQNWPVLNDAERAAIGTEYKQVSPFDARKHGAALVSKNIARLIEQQVFDRPRGWRPLVYCWRGGQRSGALSLVLGEIGFQVQVLEGGYREFRRAVLADLQQQPAALEFRVLCGRTGSAKSRLLRALAEAGAQVLDLEALACHRGSVLGPEPGLAQPSQKAFETALWQAMRKLDPARPVWAEGESRTIGRLRVPEELLFKLRAARVVQVQMPTAARVAFLLDDYGHFVQNPESFCARLDALVELRGRATVQRWQAQARTQDWQSMVGELLEQHYDPSYLKSMRQNFSGFDAAQVVELAGAAPATLHAAAEKLIATA
jgi:tRNA 2-selenouridine synthase